MASPATKARAALLAQIEREREIDARTTNVEAFLRSLLPEARVAYEARTTRGVGPQALAGWNALLHEGHQHKNRAQRRAALVGASA